MRRYSSGSRNASRHSTGRDTLTAPYHIDVSATATDQTRQICCASEPVYFRAEPLLNCLAHERRDYNKQRRLSTERYMSV